MEPDAKLFVAQHREGGYTWTYASRLSDILTEIEAKYGERDKSYTLLGYEFVDSNARIWYPGNRKHIIIQMHVKCLRDFHRGCFQLAHECVHLLSPSGKRNANVLEEGVATHFAEWYMREKMHAPNWHADHERYIRAQALVEQLLAIDADAIGKLRVVEPNFKKMDAALLLEHFPALPEDVAHDLAAPFYDGTW